MVASTLKPSLVCSIFALGPRKCSRGTRTASGASLVTIADELEGLQGHRVERTRRRTDEGGASCHEPSQARSSFGTAGRVAAAASEDPEPRRHRAHGLDLRTEGSAEADHTPLGQVEKQGCAVL